MWKNRTLVRKQITVGKKLLATEKKRKKVGIEICPTIYQEYTFGHLASESLEIWLHNFRARFLQYVNPNNAEQVQLYFSFQGPIVLRS